MPKRFRDRADAGRFLGSLLSAYATRTGAAAGGDVIVLALPRGGVPVGREVARALDASLDVIVVRKLGVPGHEELGFGAIAFGGARILNRDVVRQLALSDELIEAVTALEREELERRELLYRGERPLPDLSGKTVILVDDGLATGASMRAAVAAVRTQSPARIVVAVPTAAIETYNLLRAQVDEIVCPLTPANFRAVSLWYDYFEQLSDGEVRELLGFAHERDEQEERADEEKDGK